MAAVKHVTRIDMSPNISFCEESYTALALCENQFLSCFPAFLELWFTFKYIQGVLFVASIIIFHWCCTCKCPKCRKKFTSFKCSPKSRLFQLHLPSVSRTRTKCRPNWRHQRPRRCYWTRPQLSSNFQCFPMLSNAFPLRFAHSNSKMIETCGMRILCIVRYCTYFFNTDINQKPHQVTFNSHCGNSRDDWNLGWRSWIFPICNRWSQGAESKTDKEPPKFTWSRSIGPTQPTIAATPNVSSDFSSFKSQPLMILMHKVWNLRTV